MQSSSISSTIDRMIQVASSTKGDDEQKKCDFIPSKTWIGPKSGYYFGSSSQGTGYYLDNNNTTQQQQQPSRIKRPRSPNDNNNHNNNDDDEPKKDAKKSRVRFGQDQIQTIPSRFEINQQEHSSAITSNSTSTKSGEELLLEAEQKLASERYKPKTLLLTPTHNNTMNNTSSDNNNNNHNTNVMKQYITTLEKSISKNQLLRAQYPTQPDKFMESELSLYEDITTLKDMAAHVTDTYPEFCTYFMSNTTSSSLQQGLLESCIFHENMDIMLAVINLFVELLDPDLITTIGISDNDDEDDNDDEWVRINVGKLACLFLGLDWTKSHNTTTTTTNGVLNLTSGVTDNGDLVSPSSSSSSSSLNGLDIIFQNLGRFQDSKQQQTATNDQEEEEEVQYKGMEDILTLVENLLDLDRMGVLKYAYTLELKRYTSSSNNTSTTTNDVNIPSVASIITNSKSCNFVSYLLEKLGRRQDKSFTSIVWKNVSIQLHASEVLSTLLQHEDSRLSILDNFSTLPLYTSIYENNTNMNNKNNNSSSVVDGMEILLQCIAPYRKKDPDTEEECEFLENIFNALAACLFNHDTNIDLFLERQGVELMLRCIGGKVHSGFGSLKVLYFAISSSASSSSSNNSNTNNSTTATCNRKQSSCKRVAEVFVDAGGLKLLFPILMGRKNVVPRPAKCTDAGNLDLIKKYISIEKSNAMQSKNDVIGLKKPSKGMKRAYAANKEWYSSMESYAIQILYGLTRYLDDSSPHDAKARLISKFVESDCEKIDRLVELCLKYDEKMRRAEYNFFKSDKAEEVEEEGLDIDLAALDTKLKGGGELFYRASAILAFAAMGSRRCHEHTLEQLKTQNSGIAVVKIALEEFISVLDEGQQRHQLQKYLEAI